MNKEIKQGLLFEDKKKSTSMGILPETDIWSELEKKNNN
jgi:hypothetical protein